VSPEGNWEGKNVLHRRRTVPEGAQLLGLTTEALDQSLATSRATLYLARKERVPPLLDDKVITAWNGLMIAAMAKAKRVLGDQRYLDSAERAARFALTTLRRPDGGLFRTARGGRAHIAAYLEDYAYLADALVSLYEAGGSEEFLREAATLADRLISDFGDGDGAFFATAKDHEALVARPREGHDGAIPNANAVAARALARLGRHLERPDFITRARAAIDAHGGLVNRAPRAFATSLAVIDFLEAKPAEFAIVGVPGAPDRTALEHAVAKHYLPNHLLGHADPDQPSALPLLAGKTLVGGRAALYVCQDFACQAPITEPSAVAAALKG
jgi:uncharacterized protein YyaL (SSP411 family)